MGETFCTLTGFILTVLGMYSINILSCMSLYRWIVLHADEFYMFNDKRRVTILMRLFSLTISLVLALPPLFGWGHFMPEENGMSCAPSWKSPEDSGYNIFLFTIGFFAPVFLILFTSVSILTTIHKAKSLTQMDEIQRKIMKKQAKVFYLVGLLILSFIFCWAPYAILSILGILGLSQSVPLYVTVLPLQFAKSAILWNPILLIFKNKTFYAAGSFHLNKCISFITTRHFSTTEPSLGIRSSKLMKLRRKLNRPGLSKPLEPCPSGISSQ